MSRSCHCSKAWTARVVAGLGLFMIVTASIAEEAHRTGTKARATAATTSTATPRTSTSSASPPVAGAQSTAAGGTVPLTVICVNTVRCFSVRAPAGTPNAPAALDLRAPDISHVFSEAELRQTLQEPEEVHEIQETVQVEGQRQLTPVSIGLMAIPWAIVHPTQAWRILMPVPDAK
jgi:hypothetical protein